MFKFLLLGLLVAAVQTKQLPKYITKCKRSDPKLDKCVLEQVEKLRPRLLKGIPELRIPPYDPMVIPLVKLEQGTEAVKLIAEFKNIKVIGARNAVVDDVKLDLKNLALGINLYLPTMRIQTNYNLNGKVLVVPVQGSGMSDGNFTDVTANVTFNGKYIEKSGEKYISLDTKNVKLNIKGARLYFDNLFNGNKELTASTNKFVNENWEGIVNELKPVLEETIGSVVYMLVQHIFESYSFNELLPP